MFGSIFFQPLAHKGFRVGGTKISDYNQDFMAVTMDCMVRSSKTASH